LRSFRLIDGFCRTESDRPASIERPGSMIPRGIEKRQRRLPRLGCAFDIDDKTGG
jgi:hypothetical protein